MISKVLRTTSSLHFNTLSKQVPTPAVRIIDPKVNELTINPELLHDYNEIGSIDKVELYKDNMLIESKVYDGSAMTFTGLESFTNYTVRMSYGYDKNEGLGREVKVYTTEVSTSSDIEFTSASILNPGGIVVGNTVLFQMNIVNNDNIEFIGGVINGREYSVSLSNDQRVRIDFTVDESYGLGEVTFVLEKLYAIYNGNLYIHIN